MNYCKECKHYVVHRVDGPQCTKGKGRPTSPISTCDDFEEPAGAGDADVPSILAGVPDKTVQEEPVAEAPKPEKKRRGRKKEHENYEDENGVLMKYCRVCKQYKPAEEFYRKTGTPDGYAYECKACRTKHQRDKRAELRAGRKKEFENYVDEVTGVTMKYCRACKQYKPILAFYPKCDTADGFACECKECHNARSRGGRKPKRVQETATVEEKNTITIEAFLYSISLSENRRTGEFCFACVGSEIQKIARIFAFGDNPVRITMTTSAKEKEDAE